MIVVTSPETAVDEALEGLVMLHPGLRLLQDHRVVVREKVSLLIWCWSSWCEYVCSFCLSIWFQVTNWQKNAFPDWEWEGSTDLWRRLRAWTLLCRIYWYDIWYIGELLGILVSQHLTNSPKNTKQKTTAVRYLWPTGWHNLRGVLTSWLDPEFGPQNAYVEILATFATKMP